MLKSLLRLILVALIAVAIPIQGMTAVSAGLCMALDDGATHEAHAHSGDAGVHSHGEDAGSDKTAGNAHCPPCVSCCAAAAIVSFPRIFSPERPDSWVAIALPAPFSAVPPETLDRPPLAL